MKNNEWTEIAPLAKNVIGPAPVVFNNKFIFVIGGKEKGEIFNNDI